jgi:ABC-2 type transport system permease protein
MSVAPIPIVETRGHRLAWAVSDIRAVTWRNLLAYVRLPQLLVFSTVQPVIFVLLFRYVFGGAISVPGVPYVDYLMPGVFVQAVTFGSMATGVGLAEDLHKGMLERFRSLPMARSAVLAGRTTADLVRNIFVLALMGIVGFLVGWRVHTTELAVLAAFAIVALFAFSLSWLFAIIGLSAPSAEAAQAAAFPIIAPLVFASSAFVPVETMPGWLQAFAEHQPVTATVNAARALTLGGPTTTAVLKSLAWSAGIIAVCAPVAVRRYRRAT